MKDAQRFKDKNAESFKKKKILTRKLKTLKKRKKFLPKKSKLLMQESKRLKCLNAVNLKCSKKSAVTQRNRLKFSFYRSLRNSLLTKRLLKSSNLSRKPVMKVTTLHVRLFQVQFNVVPLTTLQRLLFLLSLFQTTR